MPRDFLATPIPKPAWLVVLVSAVVAAMSVAVVHSTYLALGNHIRGLVGYHPFSYTMWIVGVIILLATSLAGQYAEVNRGVALSLLAVALLAAFPEGACLVGLTVFALTLVIATEPLRWFDDKQFRQIMCSAITTAIVIVSYLEVWYPTTLPTPVLK